MKYPDYCYYMSGELREPKTLELIKLLEQYSNEFDYIVGTVNDLKTDEERQTVIDYILHGEDVSYENITLLAFDINLQRQNKQYRQAANYEKENLLDTAHTFISQRSI